MSDYYMDFFTSEDFEKKYDEFVDAISKERNISKPLIRVLVQKEYDVIHRSFVWRLTEL